MEESYEGVFDQFMRMGKWVEREGPQLLEEFSILEKDVYRWWGRNMR